LHRAIIPGEPRWFAYKWSEPVAQGVVADSLEKRLGIPFYANDILLTNGAYAAISVTLCAILDPGDEVIFISPPWFFYEALIVAHGGEPVRVPIDLRTFDLDLALIELAITTRTRAIIINSPNNPTGKIFPAQTLSRLALVLTAASARIGRSISILSDEAYSRIVFDDRCCPSPTQFYADTFLLYTYSKTLLTPGERIGYIALPPAMPDRERLRADLFAAQIVTGFAFSNALLQHALPDLEVLSIDIGRLQQKRDRLVNSLRALGYTVFVPEGTFYLLARSPDPDDLGFCELLAKHDILCLPGSVVELPGHFRVSLTPTDEMIDRALPGFGAALVESRRHAT
jgi:aspartate aminotransferase